MEGKKEINEGGGGTGGKVKEVYLSVGDLLVVKTDDLFQRALKIDGVWIFFLFLFLFLFG